MASFTPFTSFNLAGHDISLLTFLTGFALLLALAVPLIRYAVLLPRPILGIPYNAIAATRIMGDTPEMTASSRLRYWMREQFSRHNSPIVQVFSSPWAKPWVIVADFREAQDVLMRRLDEFDKSDRTIDSFGGVLPNSFISMKSTDRRLRHNMDLLRDLMTTTYLDEVAAPEIYKKTEAFLELWKLKTQLGNGRPFEAYADLYSLTLDLMMAIAFEFQRADCMTTKRINELNLLDAKSFAHGGQEKPVQFPPVALTEELGALVYLSESIGVGFQSIIPRIATWFYLTFRRASRQALAARRRLINRNIENSLKRLEAQKTDEKKKLRCAVDQVLLREMAIADKAGREPDFHKGAIYDELYGFVAGGTDTSASALGWFVKLMATHQPIQRTLRSILHKAHSTALAEGRLPYVQEITSTNIPYLEAVVEETFRWMPLVTTLIRQSTVDTQILGHAIPKGTIVFFCNHAESFLRPSFEISEDKRTETSKATKDLYGAWNAAGIGDYDPTRWLKKKTEDEVVFDPRAGPQMSFGAGPRSCFGRKLSYVELRIACTLLVWSFEFLEMHDERLNNFEGLDYFTIQPRDCYVKLRPTEH